MSIDEKKYDSIFGLQTCTFTYMFTHIGHFGWVWKDHRNKFSLLSASHWSAENPNPNTCWFMDCRGKNVGVGNIWTVSFICIHLHTNVTVWIGVCDIYRMRKMLLQKMFFYLHPKSKYWVFRSFSQNGTLIDQEFTALLTELNARSTSRHPEVQTEGTEAKFVNKITLT